MLIAYLKGIKSIYHDPIDTKLLINTLVGFAALWVLNFFGDFIGISLGLNWINALVVGVFGFPGVVLLLVLKYLI